MYQNFYFSGLAHVIATVTGSISAVSSSVIMYVILKSQAKLSTAYHRIMFFMSFWDICVSISIALTTIPMPKNIDETYIFHGPSYGTIRTCEVQGFIYYLGTTFCVESTCILCIFYMCVIRYEMTDETVKRRLLPISFLCSCVCSISIPSYMLWNKLLNPQPFDNFCSCAPFPSECYFKSGEEHDDGSDQLGEETSVQCIRGDQAAFLKVQSVCGVFMILAFCTVITTMVLVISKVFHDTAIFKAEVASYRARITLADVGDEEGENGIDAIGSSSGSQPFSSPDRSSRNRSTPSVLSIGDSTICSANLHLQEMIEDRDAKLELRKVILIQALMYIIAFILTWAFTAVFLAFGIQKNADWASSNPLAFLRLIFQPSQGFFNAIIFVYHKAYTLRRTDEDMGWMEAFLAVLISPSEVPEVVIEDLAIVAIDVFNFDRRAVLEDFQVRLPDSLEQSANIDTRTNSSTNVNTGRGSLGSNVQSRVSVSSASASASGASAHSAQSLWSVGGGRGEGSVASSNVLSFGTILEEEEEDSSVSYASSRPELD